VADHQANRTRPTEADSVERNSAFYRTLAEDASKFAQQLDCETARSVVFEVSEVFSAEAARLALEEQSRIS
jgi:hypothetical protein